MATTGYRKNRPFLLGSDTWGERGRKDRRPMVTQPIYCTGRHLVGNGLSGRCVLSDSKMLNCHVAESLSKLLHPQPRVVKCSVRESLGGALFFRFFMVYPQWYWDLIFAGQPHMANSSNLISTTTTFPQGVHRVFGQRLRVFPAVFVLFVHPITPLHRLVWPRVGLNL